MPSWYLAGNERRMGPGPATVVVEGPTDPNFSSVVFLLGPAGTFVEEKVGYTATPTGSPSVDATSPLFAGANSMLLASGTPDYVTYANNSALELPAGPYTIEMAVRPVSVSAGSCYFLCKDDATQRSWAIGQNNDGVFFYTFMPGFNQIASSAVLAANTWAQIAVDRNASDVTRLYVNGVVVDSNSGGMTGATSSTAPEVFGARSDGTTAYYNGRIAEVRLTWGVARYDGAYTPATAKFPRA